MVDWNPFSDEEWDDVDAHDSARKSTKKDSSPKKAVAPPENEPALHGFSRGKPAFVDIPDFGKAASKTADGTHFVDAPKKSSVPPPPPPGVKRILIIDDNIMVRRNHKIFLERLGFEVLEAVEGRNGLDKLAHYKPETISLVIVDLNMPVMTGEEFVAEARSRFQEKLPPVWVCTVSADVTTVKSLVVKGISGYLLKPVQFRAFATKLQSLFPDLELRIP